MLRKIQVIVAGEGEYSSGIDHTVDAETCDTSSNPTVQIRINQSESVRLDPEDAELLGIGLQRMAHAAKKEKQERGY